MKVYKYMEMDDWIKLRQLMIKYLNHLKNDRHLGSNIYLVQVTNGVLDDIEFALKEKVAQSK